MKPLRPAPLRPGDLVALIAPSGPVPQPRVQAAIGVLTGWGLRTKIYPQVLGNNGYLSGTDDARLADLNAALADPQVRAVWCVRGGYGLQRIADQVDVAAVRADPKLVIGFSDITALHLTLWRRAALVTLHGPVAAQLEKGPQSPTVQAVWQAVTTGAPVAVPAAASEETYAVHAGGRVRGTLLGGNLSILAASLGTPDQPDLTGSILLLEDVHERPYRVDRMLTQLLRSGVLQQAAGIAVGQFTECTGGSVPIAEVLAERLCGLGVPVLGGLPIGHGAQQMTVPLGASAVLDADSRTLVVAAATTSCS